jgi:hypothetical protein
MTKTRWNPFSPADPPFALHGPTLRHTSRLLLTTLFQLAVMVWIVAAASRSPNAVAGAMHLSFAWVVLYARIPQ